MTHTTHASRGFSTLEMLIAMTVLLLAFSATMMLLPGIQNNSVDTEVAVEALNLVERTLENQQALARKDFKLVVATTSTETIGTITYQKAVTAVSTDYFTKEVTATVSWGGMYGRAQSMTLKTVVSNFEEAVGGDTCDSILTGNWLLPPQVTHKTLGAQIMGDASGLYPITDLDAYRKRLYVTLNNTGTLPFFGPRDPGTAVNDSGTGSIAWGTPTGARLGSDTSSATATLGSGQTSNYLKVTNFGFTSAMIPDDATIVGIKVEIQRKGSSNTNTVRDNIVKIVRADGTLGGTNQAHATSWPTSDAYDTYGSASDLWNETAWSPAAIRDTDFGVVISATANGGSSTRVASVNHVRVTVTYTRQLYSLIPVFTTPPTLTFEKSIGSNVVSQGFTSLAIATSTTAGSYAYVTTASTTAQFQVINLTPTPAVVVSTYKLPNATGLVPNTIFYKDGYAYIGLPNNAGGDEFYIIDVHNPSSLPAPLATFSINAGVNTIVVKSGYAFIATDNPTKELVVLDLNDLAHPALRGIYNAPGSDTSGFGLGKSFYTVGDTLYFGRYYMNSSDPEFAVLDTTSANPSLLGSRKIGGSLDTRGVYSTIVRSNLAFLFTGNATGATSKLQILSVGAPGSITQAVSQDLVSGGEPRGFDCESNYLYAASVPSTNKGTISIITAP